MYEKTYPNKRFKLTLQFLQKHISTSETILDLGVKNPFSEVMLSEGYTVENTKGEDLDEDRSTIENSSADVVTAFEIFEHLLSPYEVLKSIKTEKLVISAPLRLWFASAYRSKTDKWDRHYHEFEDWQFSPHDILRDVPQLLPLPVSGFSLWRTQQPRSRTQLLFFHPWKPFLSLLLQP